MDRFDFSSLYRPWLVAMFGLCVFACEGGGCSSCAGCGVQPIPGAFPLEHRIDNSAQMRLTSSGLQFIEDNISTIVTLFVPGGLDFPIPPTPSGSFEVCPSGGCNVHADIAFLDLSVPAVPDNRLNAHIGVRVRTSAIPVDTGIVNCVIDLDTTRSGTPHVGLNAPIDFNNETQAARLNYTRLDVGTVTVASGEGIDDDDVDIDPPPCEWWDITCWDDWALCNIGDLGFIKNIVIQQLTPQIESTIDDALSEQLCQRVGEAGCPTGTFPRPNSNPDSICRYANSDSAECVPMLIGTDGRGDLGGTLLGGASPGTHAYAQFLLASGGRGEGVNDGISLFFHGGFMGTDSTFTVTPAHHSCVPELPAPPHPDIPRIDGFRGNVIPGTAIETHVGIGVSEDYLDYAGYGMFDSGMLCLGAGTRLSQQLSSGLVSVAIGSLSDLAFPYEAVPLTIAVRPQTPPDFTIGSGTDGDPLLQITLRTLQLDFYVWSSERYVRFMTFQTDLTIGIDLSVESNQLVPQIRSVTAANSAVSNSELLSESPTSLAAILETLVSSFAGMLSSALTPFDLPAIMGFNLEVPAGGITRVREQSHNFLGIFANLSLASGTPITAPVETRLSVSGLTLDRESMSVEGWNQGRGNTAVLEFSAHGPRGAAFEYSYRIDGGPWSEWRRETRFTIDDDVLLLQARHEIEGRARVVGEGQSVDATPARADLLVDILPPIVEAARTNDGVEVTAHDVITAQRSLEIRYQIDGGQWTEWQHTTTMAVPYDEAQVVVEVRDEAGNVGRAQAALIRGLPDPNAETCGCSAPGAGRTSLPLLALALFAVATLLVRRRGGRLAFFLVALPLFIAGCDCSGAEPCNGECVASRPPVISRGQLCCMATNMCADYDIDDFCPAGYTCALENLVADENCDVSCTMCIPKPALNPGIMATYLDSVVDDSGTVFISGYSPGNAAGADSVLYGDLVFGSWNGSGVENWEIVDGAPTSPITNDPDGWRGGVSEPGPDVGQWTSLVRVGSSFLISYYDVSSGALKLASGSPGSWAIHTIDDEGDSGRYSSMVLTDEGIPTIAYLRIAESTDTPGQIDSSVMIATATVAMPAAATDWTITAVTTSPMPCRAEFCDSSAPSCLESGECVAATSDCSETCAGDAVCFNGSCQTIVPGGFIEDLPPAIGLYTSLAVNPTGGLALVYYDRTAGNVYGVAFDGASWGTPFLIDGYWRTPDPGEGAFGDCGQGANVTVDSTGLWHAVYIDGTEEALRYALLESDGWVYFREVVDDGSTDGSNRFPDGRHIVGDDASVRVLEGGTVRIAYQDSTAQDAVLAVSAGGGWSISHLDTENSTGYWIDQELVGTLSYLTMWYRAGAGATAENGIRVFTSE